MVFTGHMRSGQPQYLSHGNKDVIARRRLKYGGQQAEWRVELSSGNLEMPRYIRVHLSLIGRCGMERSASANCLIVFSY